MRKTEEKTRKLKKPQRNTYDKIENKENLRKTDGKNIRKPYLKTQKKQRISTEEKHRGVTQMRKHIIKTYLFIQKNTEGKEEKYRRTQKIKQKKNRRIKTTEEKHKKKHRRKTEEQKNRRNT